MGKTREALAAATQSGERTSAIIDIGSNSVRLVVYNGPARAPRPIFNEKLMIGLGASLVDTGRLEQPAYDRAMRGIARFRALTEAMKVDSLRCVATAAVRDASNGAEFIADAKALGIDITLLSGREEARAAGYGVISSLPHADGIVADLGGGSLELVRVRNGTTAHHSSFPLGVLRIGALQRQHGKRFTRVIRTMLKEAGWPGEDSGLPLYLVGGSWRAVARYDMHVARDPMPVVSGHTMRVDVGVSLRQRLRKAGMSEVEALQGLSSARVETIPMAVSLMVPLVRQLGSSQLIVSASGLREGLLYEALSEDVRAQDPLMVAAEAEGRRFSRFGFSGDAFARWMAPIFADETAEEARLRRAACYLSDVASTANPDFRATRAAEMALHGHWLGIDANDRRVLAQALYTSAGGTGKPFGVRNAPMLDQRLLSAWRWGLALRLAQRLSAGVSAVIDQTRMAREGQELVLYVAADHADIIGEQVIRRLGQLANGLNLKPRAEVAG